MKREILFVTILLGMLIVPGCGMFTPTTIAHPDADLVITGTFGGFVKVAVYDFDQNALVPAGWQYVGNWKGLTVSKYPWEEHIARNLLYRTEDSKRAKEMEELERLKAE